MNRAPYLDIHTHNRTHFDGAVFVESLSVDEILSGQTKVGSFCTAGIHPWWLEDFSKEELESLKVKIKSYTSQGQLWGIGETGIDRAYPEFLDQQMELFYWHWDLAEKYNLPLIIHNVRAGSDLLGFLKKRPATTPWIFHDFRGNLELVQSLLKLHPNCFFSFGLSLDNSPQIRELLPQLPLEHIFLETDAQKHLDIHDIYLRGAEQLKIDLDFLKSQIWRNFTKLGEKHLN